MVFSTFPVRRMTRVQLPNCNMVPGKVNYSLPSTYDTDKNIAVYFFAHVCVLEDRHLWSEVGLLDCITLCNITRLCQLAVNPTNSQLQKLCNFEVVALHHSLTMATHAIRKLIPSPPPSPSPSPSPPLPSPSLVPYRLCSWTLSSWMRTSTWVMC